VVGLSTLLKAGLSTDHFPPRCSAFPFHLSVLQNVTKFKFFFFLSSFFF
jgi:hypothetical protein